MINTQPYRIKSISEYHRHLGLPKPEHPLISVINFNNVEHPQHNNSVNFVYDFYSIAMKRMKGIKYKYGQLHYDFEDDGILFFMSPNQVLKLEIIEEEIPEKKDGWVLLIHPDFIWNTSLAKSIKRYDFFDYSVNEALFLSEKEEKILNGIIENIQQEYHSNIDKFSKQIIITHIENFLSYSERFYNRQFITREKVNHQILERLEMLLSEYFESEILSRQGLPTVQFISDTRNFCFRGSFSAGKIHPPHLCLRETCLVPCCIHKKERNQKGVIIQNLLGTRMWFKSTLFNSRRYTRDAYLR
jgi:hypothetical protein